jgi:RNA polymerase sigma factor (sigma-70 family)
VTAFETPTARRNAGLETTFELAITEYGPALYGLALASTSNVADAEDAYQAALEQAWQRWGSLRAAASARPWLTKICARTAIRSRRHRLRWITRHVGMEQASTLGSLMHWDPDLGCALDQLSTRQRAVISLHYGQGYTMDEVGGLLGISGGTVRSHLNRALDHLRKELASESRS